MFLAPRVLMRRHSDYTPPLWETHGAGAKDDAAPVEPSFPPGMADPFETLNVDGGVTNNDPYNYAHDYLAALDPPREDNQLERDPCKADRAVVSIAPFPTMASYAVDYDPLQNAGVLKVMARLFQALVSQSRFYGESLSHLMRGTTFCHFMVAPSDHELVEELKHEAVHHNPIPKALQCATLAAFGGFFERGFRAHDYELGRRNCQKFLLDHFVFPAENVVMKEALAGMDAEVRARGDERGAGRHGCGGAGAGGEAVSAGNAEGAGRRADGVCRGGVRGVRAGVAAGGSTVHAGAARADCAGSALQDEGRRSG